MKQVVQDLRAGSTDVAETPLPSLREGEVLVATEVSLISAGTERMLVEFGRASLLEKAKQQPDRVKEVLQKVKTDGLLTTTDAVFSKLGQPIPLGYSNVGTVVKSRSPKFCVGQRVLSNGFHAEAVAMPHNLCALVPDDVASDEASFGVVCAIALQGIRNSEPTLGETFAVSGLGLIGLLTVQCLKANGCRVIGYDFDPQRVALANEMGAEAFVIDSNSSAVDLALQTTGGSELDGVIVTASTSSNAPLVDAARMCRRRGRVTLVGVTGMNLPRKELYEKEIRFTVSCSYGPGRYDPRYETLGLDFPRDYVRWTAGRNFEAALFLMRERRLDLSRLMTHRFKIGDAPLAYKALVEDGSALGILLEYPSTVAEMSAVELKNAQVIPVSTQIGDVLDASRSGRELGVSFVGAGNYGARVLIPAFKKNQAKFITVASKGGLSARLAASRAGFLQATTDEEAVFNDDSSAVVISSPHNQHARQVVLALTAGKHVFVEKPLCLTLVELEAVESAFRAQSGLQLMIGFNRRFSVFAQKMKRATENLRGPKTIIYTVNAGSIPQDHWTQDLAIGGGRIVGEGCHFIDFCRFLTGSEIVSVDAFPIMAPPEDGLQSDKCTLQLGFIDGSTAAIHYFANGSKSFPKERVELFSSGKTIQLDNFKALRGYGISGLNSKSLFRQHKGQVECVSAFLQSLKTGRALIPPEEIFEVSRFSIRAQEILNAKVAQHS